MILENYFDKYTQHAIIREQLAVTYYIAMDDVKKCENCPAEGMCADCQAKTDAPATDAPAPQGDDAVEASE